MTKKEDFWIVFFVCLFVGYFPSIFHFEEKNIWINRFLQKLASTTIIPKLKGFTQKIQPT